MTTPHHVPPTQALPTATKKRNPLLWVVIALGTLLLGALLYIAYSLGSSKELDVQVPAPGPSDSLVSTPQESDSSGVPSPDESAQPTPTPTETNPGTESAFLKYPQHIDTVVAELAASGNNNDELSLLQKIADQPAAVWLVSNDAGSLDKASAVAKAAKEQNAIAVVVIYGIPNRDCSGGHSAGGFTDVGQYAAWADQIADRLNGVEAWAILEPDALADTACWNDERASALSQAAERMSAKGVQVYVDAGHSQWNSAEETVDRLNHVGVDSFAGFATNVSNFNSTADEESWANLIAQRINKPFVIDTSRNGKGSNGEWCNPSGRGLGDIPSFRTNGHFVANLWIKVPGESDGECNGGPAAGTFWKEYALDLARNSNW